jgi:hypothetical protein
MLDEVPEITSRLRVETRGWFVQKDEPRAIDERDSQQ